MDVQAMQVIQDAIAASGYEVEQVSSAPSYGGPPMGGQNIGTTKTIEGDEVVVIERVMFVAKKTTRTPIAG